MNLTEIKGMKEYLNTSETWNMNSMFDNCSSLKSIDLSGFNTANVKYMHHMFCNCSSLTSLDVSNFNTSNVTDMIEMFSGLSVTSLDLSSFNTKNVVEMFGMFSVCSNLYTIYVSDGWVISPVASATNMFIKCDNLYGGQGSSVNELRIYDATYAKIDGGESDPGYFTKEGEPAFIQPPTTPVSEISEGQNNAKVWAYNSIIYLESAPDTKYTIIDLNGRILKSSTTKSTKEEISTLKSGVYIVIFNGESYKVSVL